MSRPRVKTTLRKKTLEEVTMREEEHVKGETDDVVVVEVDVVAHKAVQIEPTTKKPRDLKELPTA